jgi:hypothetical protein
MKTAFQPNGTKTWLFRYRRPSTGKENFLSLGPYPDISLIEARRSATTARNLVREGTDPVEHRRAESATRKRVAEGAFHLVAQRWLDFKRKEMSGRDLSKGGVRRPRIPDARASQQARLDARHAGGQTRARGDRVARAQPRHQGAAVHWRHRDLRGTEWSARRWCRPDIAAD